jgi:hypothetical protein
MKTTDAEQADLTVLTTIKHSCYRFSHILSELSNTDETYIEMAGTSLSNSY